ncbi:hypothetical protein HQ33_07700 [Limosilactobacillus reuteri]|nr:hypothetical protein HQ33_07700 [Limosilactobacillus reuteri]
MLTDENDIQVSEIQETNPPLNQPFNNKTMYYCYDKSGNYTGFVYSDIQPTNSTDKAPTKQYRDESGKSIEGITVGLNNPKWNGTAWIEQAVVSKEQQLAQLALQQAQFQASQQKLYSQLALQLAQITAKEAQNV